MSGVGKRSLVVAAACVAAAGMILFAHSSHAAKDTPAPQPGTTQFYESQVKPIFQSNCYRCHSGFNHRGGLQLDTKEHILRGGKNGPVIVPGHPEQSLLLRLVQHQGPANDPMPMPPKRKLSDADIATIARWIQAGALMPDVGTN
ncbi:MAG TPA: c-type cytochrome domain-containing protein [Candidatus Aquilonibacter sp.]|nr:c-type cytochrome domain-containing protein [Candidatus Aquilonibacter sp.]